MRDFDVCAALFWREFPTDQRATVWIFVPVGDPGIGENAGRITLDHFTVAFEFADTVDDGRYLFAGVGVTSADPRLHLPELYRTFAVGEPALELACIAECFENALGRSRDLNFGDDGVLIWSNNGCSHDVPYCR